MANRRAREPTNSRLRFDWVNGVKVSLSVERDSKEISLDRQAHISVSCGIGSRGENQFPVQVNDCDNILALKIFR